MDLEKKILYKKIFENKLLKSSGDEYQQLFYQIMQIIERDFIKVENQGCIGDRKCDGYIKGSGKFFQVYAQKAYTLDEKSTKNACKKLNTDFYELKNIIENESRWEPIKQYVFVIKTHRGTYPDILEEIAKLAKDNKGIHFYIWDINNFLEMLTEIESEETLVNIVGYYFGEIDFNQIRYSIFEEIVNHLRSTVISENADYSLILPEFEEKLKFNNLSPYFAGILQTASYYKRQLDDFLDSYRDISIAQDLCTLLRNIYQEAKETYPKDSDQQLLHIINSCYHETVRPQDKQIIETNIYVILAKYFETCDIFESPPNN